MKYFFSVPLAPHNSTDLYHAGWSVLTQLLGLHPVCRHETYPVTIFHVTFYFSGWICADLKIEYSSVARFSSRITMVTTILVQAGFVVERVTLGHPPSPINSACSPSLSFHNWCLFTLNPPITEAIQSHDFRRLSSSLLVSLFISFCDVMKHLTGVEASSIA